MFCIKYLYFKCNNKLFCDGRPVAILCVGGGGGGGCKAWLSGLNTSQLEIECGRLLAHQGLGRRNLLFSMYFLPKD